VDRVFREARWSGRRAARGAAEVGGDAENGNGNGNGLLDELLSQRTDPRPATNKEFGIVDGEERYAGAVISTRRGVDPASSA
jgi:hypothetical protein